jgi:Protein of unknown function (DUF4199)
MEPQNESENTTVTTRSVGMRYGLFMGGAGIVVFLIIALSGMKPDGPFRWVGVVITAVLMFMAHKYFKDNGDGYMTVGQGTGIGFWSGITSSVISSIFTYIYVKFIDAGFVEALKDAQVEAMQQKGMSDDQIEQGMKIASMFVSPEALLIFGLLFGVLGGLIIGVIIAIFTQKKNPDAIPS